MYDTISMSNFFNIVINNESFHIVFSLYNNTIFVCTLNYNKT